MDVDKFGYHAEINKYKKENGYTIGILDSCKDNTNPDEFAKYFEFIRQVKRMLDHARKIDKKFNS